MWINLIHSSCRIFCQTKKRVIPFFFKIRSVRINLKFQNYYFFFIKYVGELHIFFSKEEEKRHHAYKVFAQCRCNSKSPCKLSNFYWKFDIEDLNNLLIKDMDICIAFLFSWLQIVVTLFIYCICSSSLMNGIIWSVASQTWTFC